MHYAICTSLQRISVIVRTMKAKVRQMNEYESDHKCNNFHSFPDIFAIELPIVIFTGSHAIASTTKKLCWLMSYSYNDNIRAHTQRMYEVSSY